MPRGRPRKITSEPARNRNTVYDAKNKDKKEKETRGFFDFFRLDESYTSLLLGIIVVIIAAVLFVSFFKNQNIFKPHLRQEIATQEIGPDAATQSSTLILEDTPTVVPTKAPQPTAQPTKVVQPTIQPTKVPQKQLAATAIPTQKITPTTVNTKSEQEKSLTPTTAQKTTRGGNKEQTKYTVAAGDDLWNIAAKHYNDGYQWVKIAQANNLTDPNTIHVGDTLNLPAMSQQQNTGQHIGNGTVQQQTPGSYTVVHGDNLWNIAVKVYGDGYQWTRIAQANHLVNPQVIHAGNVLTIPR